MKDVKSFKSIIEVEFSEIIHNVDEVLLNGCLNSSFILSKNPPAVKNNQPVD